MNSHYKKRATDNIPVGFEYSPPKFTQLKTQKEKPKRTLYSLFTVTEKFIMSY